MPTYHVHIKNELGRDDNVTVTAADERHAITAAMTERPDAVDVIDAYPASTPTPETDRLITRIMQKINQVLSGVEQARARGEQKAPAAASNEYGQSGRYQLHTPEQAAEQLRAQGYGDEADGMVQRYLDAMTAQHGEPVDGWRLDADDIAAAKIYVPPAETRDATIERLSGLGDDRTDRQTRLMNALVEQREAEERHDERVGEWREAEEVGEQEREHPYPVSEYRGAIYTPAKYSAPNYAPAGPEAAHAESESAAEAPREQRAEVGPSADGYEQLAMSYRAWAKEAHESSLDGRAREFNGYAHFYDEQAAKLRDVAEVDAAIAAPDASAEHEEAGSLTDVIVEEQMSAAGRSAYWQAISEGATPDQAYNDAEAVEYQERRAAEAAEVEKERAQQEAAEAAWRDDTNDGDRAVACRG
ncbi:hypothetical protein ACQPZQ_02360 [Pseudonocardia sp. CA-142604]|uniref:hypothetical protein n=1 Tax=Pseudonocardia sp. CA-142604 TaxID=3240024 RepID=UPI003D940BAE